MCVCVCLPIQSRAGQPMGLYGNVRGVEYISQGALFCLPFLSLMAGIVYP